MKILVMCVAGGTLCMFVQLAFNFSGKARKALWGNVPAFAAVICAFGALLASDAVANRGVFFVVALVAILTSSRFGAGENERADTTELITFAVVYALVSMVGIAIEQYGG